MEYFGNRYAEYTPTTPSQIVEILRSSVVERQLPSDGLSADHLAYTLKNYGLGPKLYHKDCFSEINNILSCYVESGIPTIVTLSNDKDYNNKLEPSIIRHAVLCIGHEKVTCDILNDAFRKANEYKTQYGSIKILDYDSIKKNIFL